jgi:hypothetical protein
MTAQPHDPTPPPPPYDLTERLAALRYADDSLSGQIGAVSSAVNIVHGQVGALRTEMREGFAAVERRFEGVDARFDGIEGVLQQILARLPEQPPSS